MVITVQVVVDNIAGPMHDPNMVGDYLVGEINGQFHIDNTEYDIVDVEVLEAFNESIEAQEG